MQERDTLCPFSGGGICNVSLSIRKCFKCLITTGMLISIHFGTDVFIECALGQWMLNGDTCVPLRENDCDSDINHKSSYNIH